MMISCSDSPKPNLYLNMDWKTLLLSAVILSAVSLLFILPSSNTFRIIEPIQGHNKYIPILGNTSSEIEQLDKSARITHEANHYNPNIIAPSIDEKEEECDLFAGQWVTEPRGSIYTNWTCPMLPDSKNCGKYGKGVEHVFWKWEPRGCELPRFDPNTFLSIVRGKKMAFVGDSLARNQMESLLCFLTQAETGTGINNGANEKFQTWYYPSHDFTLTFIWAEFLVDRTERTVNGTGTGVFDLHLDRVNPIWAEKLPGLHYLIISGGNWFSRKNYYYENNSLIGCVFCHGENLTDLGPGFAIRKAFRTSLQFISRCEECDGLVTLLRTYSPGHFEHGSWYTGGYCNRTRPLDENETEFVAHKLDFRMIQLEEVGKVKKEWKGNRKIEVLDVTKAMVMRADGHPDSFFNGRDSTRIASDCLHWCLPGPIDMWNDVLLATLKKKSLLL